VSVPESVPCICCGRLVAVTQHDGRFSLVEDGIWIVETGNYGSTVLDDPPGRLAAFMVVCDPCLLARRHRVYAVRLPRDGDQAKWERLDTVPQELIRSGGDGIDLEKQSRQFVCHCGVSAGGVGLESAACKGHGPMRELSP
jgi:hypothetical protein